MKSETVALLEKAEENIRAADTLIKAQFFEIAETVEIVNHAEDFLVAARNYLARPASPTP